MDQELSILLVEDDPQACEKIATYIEGLGDLLC